MINEKNHISRLKSNEITCLAEFVVSENFKHHGGDTPASDYKKAVHSLCSEEISYSKNSEIFVVKDRYKEILGSIRVLKWNYEDILPLQKIFGINPLQFLDDDLFRSVWHIGRFAIKREMRDATLFKKLMVCAISPICKNEENIAFAECDSKLLRVLALLGINCKIIGESINYLGSETIPICLKYDGLIDFYRKNTTLVPRDVLEPAYVM